MTAILGQNIIKEILEISNNKLSLIKEKKDKHYDALSKYNAIEAIFNAALEIYTPQLWDNTKVKVYCKYCKYFSKGDGSRWYEKCNATKSIISDTYYEPKGEVTNIRPCDKNFMNQCKDYKKK